MSSAEEQIPSTAPEDGSPSLLERLRYQLEFYFSPQNLQRDTYLRNMLTVEQHTDMPTPRPMQYMCPTGIVTNFPKVKDICAQFSDTDEPVALLLGKALDGSLVATTDGNWIGPVNQTLPPPIEIVMGGTSMGMGGSMGGQPQFQPPYPYQMQNQGYFPGMGIHPGAPPIQQQQQGAVVDSQGMMYNQQQQHPDMMPPEPHVMGPPPNVEIPNSSAASVGSLSSQQQPLQQQNQQNIPQVVLDGSISSRVSTGSVSSMSGGQEQKPSLPPHQGGVMPYPYPPSAGVMPPQMQGMMPPLPGGQPPYPTTSPYYNPQQMYGYGYMQQQQGGPPQMMQQQYPPSQMGYRMPPPMPQQGYPANGPPPPYPYPLQAMQQQQFHNPAPQQHYGYPPQYPQQQHQRHQFHDNNRRVGSPSFQHGNDLYNNQQHYGKKQGIKNKKKGKNNNQFQQQKRGSYSPSDNGYHYNQGNNFRHDHSRSPRHDQSLSPPPHNQGGRRSNNWKNSDDQQQFRRDHGNSASPSHNNRHKNNNNRNQNHHGQDRLSRSDTSGKSRKKMSAADREIFTSSDFPGLEGEGDKKASNSNLVGYASALLKKKEADNASGTVGSESQNDDNDSNVAPSKSSQVDDAEADRTRQTEEMERDILSEFHDLSMIGNEDDIPSPQRNNKHAGSSDGKTEGTVLSSSASIQSNPGSQTRALPILPAPVGYATPEKKESTIAPEKKKESSAAPAPVDIRNSHDFPSRDNGKEEGSDDKPKEPIAWGSKSFAEVRVKFVIFFFDFSLLSHISLLYTLSDVCYRLSNTDADKSTLRLHVEPVVL